MSKKQAALIRKYEKLNPTTRSIVKAAAAACEPLSRTKLVDLAARAGVLTESGRRPIFKTERQALDTAIQDGVLHYVSSSPSGPIVIANEIQDYVFRDAFFSGLAQAIVSEEREAEKNRYTTHFLGLETVVRNMRMAFYGGDVETWSQCVSDYTLRPILLDPFCPESFARLSANTRALYFEMFSQDLVTQVEELNGFRDFVASYVDTLDDSRGDLNERAIVAAIDLFVAEGNLPALRGLGQRLTKPRSEISGCIAFLTGQYATAREQFEQAIKETRKRTKKRRIELRHLPSLFYAALLLKDNTPQSRKTLNGLCSTIEDWETPYWALAAPLFSAHNQQSKPLESRLPLDDPSELFPPLGGWTAGLIWCWQFSDSEAPFTIGHFRRLSDQYRACGLDWLAAEASAILARARSASGDAKGDATQDDFSRETHAKLGTVSIVEFMQPLPAWENGLVALENLCVGDSPAGPVDETTAELGTERIIWQLDYSESGSWLIPHPYLQKLGKNGWSKGRRVALERLYDQWQSVSFDFLTDQDRVICQCLEHSTTYNHYGYRESVYDWNVAALAKALVGHPNLYQSDDRTQAIEISQSKPYLSITSSGNAIRLAVKPSFDSGAISIQRESASRISLVEFSDRQKTIAKMVAGLPEIPASQQDRVAQITRSISSMIDVQSDLDGTHGTGETVEAVAETVVQLTPYHEGLRAEVFVQPLGEKGPFFRPGSGAASVLATIDGKALCATRELDAERANLERILTECHSLDTRVTDPDQTEWLFSESEDALELACELHALVESGNVVVIWPRGKTFDVAGRASTSSFQVSVRRDRDWFAASGKLSVDNELTLDMMNLLELVADSPSRFVRLDDGRILALTTELRKRIADIVAMGNPLKKKMRFSPVQALAFEAALEGTVVKTDKHWKEHMARIQESATIDVLPPTTLQAELRDYQTEGYAWLKRLAHWNTGACLADDMGLGKTIQALALLADRAWDGPALVVAPASVGFNWESETRRFAPTLTPKLFRDCDRDKFFDDIRPGDLVIASYGLVQSEVERFTDVSWGTIVLDEAQAIKNSATRRSQAVMQLKGEFKVILTGTPLENHLGELWNLFRFIAPGLLGSNEEFRRRFSIPIERDQSRRSRNRLKQLIQPFLLRRTKTEVLSELPLRSESVVDVELSPAEVALYEALRLKALERIRESVAEGGAQGETHLQVLAELTRLRLACCHPSFVGAGDIEGSKLQLFRFHIRELVEGRHKVLVFSQFVKHLEILRDELEEMGVGYQYLDGSTPVKKRKQIVEAFQGGTGEVFLISLKAGGTGLNLTAADYVIHMDPWWNPAVEDQATDRAHRIGQNRPVNVYRFIAKGTIEEKIVNLHQTKRDLADSLLSGANVASKLSTEDLIELLTDVTSLEKGNSSTEARSR